MSFEIIRNDLANVVADAIVNPANPRPTVGAGTDAAIHAKAGPALLEARKKIGSLAVGEAAVTGAFGLDAKYVIHVSGPVWQGGNASEQQMLRQCYDKALAFALELGCESVAFPLLAAGSYGFPRQLALETAISAFTAFLAEHEMKISLVVFNRDAFVLSEQIIGPVKSYIDENYVALHESPREEQLQRRRREAMFMENKAFAPSPAAFEPKPKSSEPAKLSLEELLEQTDAGFSETLLMLIDQSGKKDSEIYTRANISRQHFSKIRSNPVYKPTKPTVLAFALALELNMAQTRDLLNRAGYALSRSSKFDIVLEYYISNGKYDVIEINQVLFSLDQSLIGQQ